MVSDTLSLPLSRGLAAEIAARLSTAIVAGELGPGERLREEALAETLGVSRGPIREAFAQLERQGLIVIRRNRGAFVARLSREDVDEVYSLRRAIERFAMQRAVRYADDAKLAEMEALVEAMARYTDRVTEQEAALHDISFHDLIYQAASHQRLYECWVNLRPQIHIMLLSRNVANPDFRDYAAGGHRDLLNVLRDRDEERALIEIDAHLHVAYDRVIKSYEPATAKQNGKTRREIGL